MTDSTLQFDTELAELRSMLSSDGFGLEATGRSGQDLDLQVVVISSEACADCLVPKDLMRDLISKRLEQFDLHLGALDYPVDLPDHA